MDLGSNGYLIVWWMGPNGYMMVDGIQVEKVTAVSQSKVKYCMVLEHCLHWLHVEPTHH
jgi:hypothetical protein